jgi:hypothetical protein
LQAAGDASRTIGDLGMAAPALAASDAEEEWLGVGHCVLLEF